MQPAARALLERDRHELGRQPSAAGLRERPDQIDPAIALIVNRAHAGDGLAVEQRGVHVHLLWHRGEGARELAVEAVRGVVDAADRGRRRSAVQLEVCRRCGREIVEVQRHRSRRRIEPVARPVEQFLGPAIALGHPYGPGADARLGIGGRERLERLLQRLGVLVYDRVRDRSLGRHGHDCRDHPGELEQLRTLGGGGDQPAEGPETAVRELR